MKFISYGYVAAYLALLLLAGYVVLCAIAGRAKRHPLEILGLSGLIGSVVMGTLLFWVSLVGTAPRRGLLALLLVLSLGTLIVFVRADRLVSPSWWRPRLAWADLWIVPIGVPIAWLLWAASVQTLGFPLIDWDGFATWGFRAKALYLDSLPNLHGYFHDLSLGFATPDHPLLLPFLTAGAYAALGEINEALGKLVVLFLLWCYVFFLYGILRSLLPRPAVLGLTAIAVCAPAVLRWGVQGTPDMPLAIFYAASLYFVVRWIGGGPRSDAWLAGLFSVACILVKNEGLPIAVFNLLAMAAFGWRAQPRFGRDLATVAGVCVASVLPWMIFRHTLPHIGENYPRHLNWATIVANRERLPVVLAAYCERMFLNWNWSFDWLLALGLFFTVNALRPTWPARILLLLLLAHLGTYMIIYIITPYSFSALLAEPMDRLLLHVLPAGILLMAFSLAQIVPRDAVAARPPSVV